MRGALERNVWVGAQTAPIWLASPPWE